MRRKKRNGIDDRTGVCREPAQTEYRVYMFGEKIENWVDHPMIRPSINCVAMTYALAQDRSMPT